MFVYPEFDEGSNAKTNFGGNYSEGIASISAVLKEAGHEVFLFHVLYDHSKQEFMEKVKSFGADIIGFVTRTTAFETIKEMISWTKEALPESFIVCGSYHVTLVPKEVLAVPGVNAVCIGEGEYPLRELCNHFKSGDFYNIESLYFKDKDGNIIQNSVACALENLDELPIPDFDIFNFTALESVKVNSAIVMLSRGCLFSCTYCGNSQFRNVYPNRKNYARFRSPENAIHYIEVLLEKYPFIEFINFRDAIFNMYPDWFDRFIEMYKERFGLPFTCNLRLDIMTEDTVRKLKEAGCYLIDVGVESGDEEIRKKYLKRMMTDEQMINAFGWFHKYKIPTLTYNIVGLPHEDLHKALKTIKLNVKLNPDRVTPNIFYPYPMTVLESIARKAGFVPDVIPPGTKVPLVQENFPEHQVLFAANFFMIFIRLYKLAGKMPRFFGKPFEKLLDVIFTGRFTPRKLLNFLYTAANDGRRGLKLVLINKMPKLYVKLRRARAARIAKKAS